MREHVTIRLPKRLLRVALVLAVAAAVVTPIAVSASHQFTDVPDTNIFHNNIGWMADNGITAGCNQDGDEYCPGDFVTRGQMAAFMQRLAENKVVDAATADDADMLDGLDANQLLRVAYDVATFDAFIGDGVEDGDILTTMIEAPIDGFLVVSASSDVYAYSDDDTAGCAIAIDDVIVQSSTRQFEVDGTSDTNQEEDCDSETVVPVEAGEYEVSFVTRYQPASGVTFDEASLSVLFVPFDGYGDAPTDFTVEREGLDAVKN